VFTSRCGATYMQFHCGGAACDDLRLAYSKIMTEYEVYNEDDFEEMPRVLALTAIRIRQT